MSLQTIRAHFESWLTDQLNAMATPPGAIVYDNVQETPPVDTTGDWVLITISYPSLTEPILCPDESGIDVVRGNIQVNCYAPRGRGMKRVEELVVAVAIALNTIKAAPDPNGVRPSVGVMAGPETLGAGDDPWMQSVISAPFMAKG